MFTIIKEHEYLVKLDGRNFEVILHDNFEPFIYYADESEVVSPSLRERIMDVVRGFELSAKPEKPGLVLIERS